MLNENNKKVSLRSLILFIGDSMGRYAYIFIPLIIFVFYATISFLDLGKINFGYMLVYFWDSLSLHHITEALKYGSVIRLISLIIALFSIFYVFKNFYKRFFARLERVDKNIILVIIIFVLIGLKLDLTYMEQSGSGDLRNRLVGARSALAGYQPYFFKWIPGMSLKLLDPFSYMYQTNRPVSRLSVTPTNILIFMAFSGMEYSHIRVLWFYIQYLTFWVSALILVIVLCKKYDKKLLILSVVLLFSVSYAWRLHVERGQIYSLYTLVYCLFLMTLLKGGRRRDILSALFLSFLISLRPTFVLFLIPFLIFGNLKIVKYTIISGIFIFLITTLLLGKGIWGEYRRYMVIRDTPVVYEEARSLGTLQNGVIENVKNIDKMVSINSGISAGDSSIRCFLWEFLRIPTGTSIYGKGFLIILIISTGILIFMKFRNINASVTQILIISNGMQLFSDLMVPIVRYSYVDVMAIPMIALVVYDSANAKNFLVNRFGWVPIFGILLNTSLINTGSFINPVDAVVIGQLLIYSYLIGYAIMMVKNIFKK